MNYDDLTDMHGHLTILVSLRTLKHIQLAPPQSVKIFISFSDNMYVYVRTQAFLLPFQISPKLVTKPKRVVGSAKPTILPPRDSVF